MINQLLHKNRCTGLKTGSFWHRGATIFILLIGILVFSGCKTKEIPVEIKYETHYTDSVRLKDSVVVIPIERIVDIVPWYDTLRLESSMAISDAWIDTTNHVLQGRLENKKGCLYRIKYVDRIVKNDSIIEKEKPIYIKGDTVEVRHIPKWAWICLCFTVLVVFYIAWSIYKKIKIPI